MLNDKDRFTSDIFQRRVGEDSDSNDDSDILDEQIQYNFDNENQSTSTNVNSDPKSNFNIKPFNKQKDNRIKNNNKSDKFYNYKDEDYHNTHGKHGNYDNYNFGYGYLNDKKPQKKEKIRNKNKNYHYDDNNNYDKHYNYCNGYHDNYNNNNRKYDDYYKVKPFYSNYNEKKNEYYNYEASKTKEQEVKFIQSNKEINNNGSKRQFFNKYDNLIQKDPNSMNIEVTDVTDNNVIAYKINKNLIYPVDNCPNQINLNEFVGKLNVNAKEFVPRNYNQWKYQR